MRGKILPIEHMNMLYQSTLDEIQHKLLNMRPSKDAIVPDWRKGFIAGRNEALNLIRATIKDNLGD